MKVNIEQSGRTIGVDNSITEAMRTGEWGVRLAFSGEELNNRYEVVLTVNEAEVLKGQLENIISSIKSQAV